LASPLICALITRVQRVLRYMILMDARLGLLAPPQTADPTLAAAFDDLRTAIQAIKRDRNAKVAHAGLVSTAEYDEAIRNIRRFAVACVDKCGLFDAAWKERLLTTVAAVSVARYTRHEPRTEGRTRHQKEVRWTRCARNTHTRAP
jgi:hypothetical protein